MKKALIFAKEHLALSLSLAANIALTAGIVWQAHQIAVLKQMVFKLWIVLQILTHGQPQ